MRTFGACREGVRTHPVHRPLVTGLQLVWFQFNLIWLDGWQPKMIVPSFFTSFGKILLQCVELPHISRGNSFQSHCLEEVENKWSWWSNKRVLSNYDNAYCCFFCLFLYCSLLNFKSWGNSLKSTSSELISLLGHWMLIFQFVLCWPILSILSSWFSRHLGLVILIRSARAPSKRSLWALGLRPQGGHKCRLPVKVCKNMVLRISKIPSVQSKCYRDRSFIILNVLF